MGVERQVRHRVRVLERLRLGNQFQDWLVRASRQEGYCTPPFLRIQVWQPGKNHGIFASMGHIHARDNAGTSFIRVSDSGCFYPCKMHITHFCSEDVPMNDSLKNELSALSAHF